MIELINVWSFTGSDYRVGKHVGVIGQSTVFTGTTDVFGQSYTGHQ